MVSKDDIERVLNSILNNGLNVKCTTLAEMHEILGKMGYTEQFKQLKENDYLNPLEVEDYEETLKFKRLLEEQ